MPTLVINQPTSVDLQMYRGDSGGLRVTVVDAAGLPVDLTGAVWLCQLRVTVDAATPIATFPVTPTAGDTSSVDIDVNAPVTAILPKTCVWDLQMVLGGETTTLLAGLAKTTPDVSRAP